MGETWIGGQRTGDYSAECREEWLMNAVTQSMEDADAVKMKCLERWSVK